MTNETLDQMWNILRENNFQIDDVIKSEIICTNCKHVLIKPYIVPCGCKYCYDCLISYLNGEEKFCSGDSDDCQDELINIDTNVFIDQHAIIKISRIVVKCPLDYCVFETELRKMADHMRTCDRKSLTCLYSDMGCDYNKTGVDNMKLHFKEENYCHARLLMEFLDNWKNEVKLLKSKMFDLQEEIKWIKEEMESKQETISAIQKNLGKLFEENRSLKELETEKNHRNNQIEVIISDMQRKSQEQKDKLEKNLNKLQEMEISQEDMRMSIEKIKEENKSLREEIEIIKLDNNAKQEMISVQQTKLMEKLQEIGKENLELLEKKQERLTIITDKISKRENEIKIREIKLPQAQANQDYEFVWCINSWTEKIRRARNRIQAFIFSDPFYSHKNGYKMCLKLFPGSYFFGKETYLSLYVCIMRGEYDNILEWPFKHVIKLDLINQETKLPHVTKIVDSKDRSSSHWKKPNDERNFECGYSDFIELSELTSNDALCRENKIFVKATLLMNPSI